MSKISEKAMFYLYIYIYIAEPSSSLYLHIDELKFLEIKEKNIQIIYGRKKIYTNQNRTPMNNK